MKILAIETSCDDTGIAFLECSGGLKKPRFKILKSIVSSQVKVHQPYHGVVPNLAKREHIKNLPRILKKLIVNSKKLNVGVIAVTVGPGLEPALWTGINFAEELAKKLNKPLIGINHLEGHIYSNLLPSKNSKHEARNSKQFLNSKFKIQNGFGFRYSDLEFPAIVLLVSGGHTILLKMDSLTKWTKLGETLDDAAGEAFDKVARMLGLKYPGGPEISKLALKGNPKAVAFPRPMLNKPNYDFSFSGLKTSVLYYLRDHSEKLKVKSFKLGVNVAASFQQAVVDVLVGKTMRAAREYEAKSILLCGGVAANKSLRNALRVNSEKLGVNFFVPDFEFNTDNATMIAAAAYINILAKKEKLPIEARGDLSI
ncbi:MAG: tRNA (adenosine(37)-N6)-threonylcarbamoyltransferase complex transferase subunit TsaD [bacterium]|nr:tRNA (adenosine(37)-N6)-threonylcarbamoyltransferase complex transferase subunit TsaD [bacterium]